MVHTNSRQLSLIEALFVSTIPIRNSPQTVNSEKHVIDVQFLGLRGARPVSCPGARKSSLRPWLVVLFPCLTNPRDVTALTGRALLSF